MGVGVGRTDSEEEIVGAKDETSEHKDPVSARATDPHAGTHTNTHALYRVLAVSVSVSMCSSLYLSLSI